MLKKILSFIFFRFLWKYHLEVLVLYVFITFIYLYPVFQDWLKSFNLANFYVIGSADTYNQFLPLRVFLSNNLKRDIIPLWFDNQALGLPFLGIIQSGAFYPFNLVIFKFLDPYVGYNLGIFLHFVMAEFFAFLYSFYLISKVEDNKLISKVLAFMSGILFGLSGFIVSHVDFVPLQNSLPYLVLSIFAIHLIIDNYDLNKKLIDNIVSNIFYIVLLGLSLLYQFLAGYPQAFLYTFLAVIIYILISKNFRVFILFLISFILFLLGGWIVLYEGMKLASISVRDILSSSIYNQGSYPIYALIMQVIPYIFGGSVYRGYYGPETGTISFEFINYISVLALPLSVFALIYIFKDIKKYYNYRFIVILGIIAFLLALGKYNILHYFLYDIPFYSKVRIVARHLMEFNLFQAIVIPLSIYLLIIKFEFDKLINFVKVSFYVYLLVLIFFNIYLVNSKVSQNISSLNISSVELFFPILFFFIYFVIFIIFLGGYKILRNSRFLVDFKIFVLLLFNFMFLVESLYLFYNLSPNYKSIWWSKVDNIKSYVYSTDFVENEYRMGYLIGFPLLVSAINDKKMLNYYEPVINKDFLFLFNIWMNGSFLEPTDYFFLINNSIFSAYSVKYLIINNEFDNLYKNLTSITLLRPLNYSEYLKKIKYYNIDLTKLETKNIVSSYTYDNSIKNYYYSVLLTNDSSISYSFEIKPETEVLALAIKVKLTKENLKTRYRKLIFNQSDGLGIDLRDQDNNSLCYYFVNDYYFNNSDYSYICIPLVLRDKKSDSFDGKVKLNIYSLYSYSRYYQIKQIEILEYPFAFIPYFKDDLKMNFDKINYNKIEFSNAYYYLKNVMDKKVYVNDQALPFVFYVNKIKLVKDLNEVKYYFYFLKFNPFKEALITQDFIYSSDFKDIIKNKKYLNYFNLLRIKPSDFKKYVLDTNFSDKIYSFKINSIKNGEIKISLNSSSDSFIVVNNLYFKGFKAYLKKDNNSEIEVPVVKVNGLVKGIVIPKGNYVLSIVYKPYSNFLIVFNLVYILFLLPFILLIVGILKFRFIHKS
ncbi:MAG: hypothetical protein ACP5RD_05580 [bacterium]